MSSSASLANELLVDLFDRVRESVHQVVEGLSLEQLATRVDPEANSVAWLVWHLTRVQDDHLADAVGDEQVWTAERWVDRFDLPFAASAIGYGHSTEEVAQVRASADLLAGYHDAVHKRSIEWVTAIGEADFARVVDDRWDPPVTLSVRLVSVVNDVTQHVGQAAFLRGLIDRRG
jgi:uncharacterized damage-inducible protein DinB